MRVSRLIADRRQWALASRAGMTMAISTSMGECRRRVATAPSCVQAWVTCSAVEQRSALNIPAFTGGYAQQVHGARCAVDVTGSKHEKHYPRRSLHLCAGGLRQHGTA